jgi:NTE family protein
MTEQRVAVVLSGAAARGAFQAGALARVLQHLAAEGSRPSVFVGTSAGGINAALWGSLCHLGADEGSQRLVDVWRSMDRPDIFAHPLTTLLKDGVRFLPGALFGRGNGIAGLLDTGPLRHTAEEVFQPEQLARNIADGVIDGVGVVATRVPGPTEPIASGRTVVFLDTALPSAGVADPQRAVDVALGPISAEQVLASAAIPVAFPAQLIGTPPPSRGWYLDGGTRMNAPLRPAVALGADRIIVIAANSTQYGSPPVPAPDDEPAPDLADAGAMALHTILADRVTEDLIDLRTRNQLADQVDEYRTIEFLTVSPLPGKLADLAELVISQKQRSWWRNLLAESDTYALERALRGLGEGSGQRELLSYVLFDDEYFSAQIALGDAAARTALSSGWAL